jgi:hypothetical protein
MIVNAEIELGESAGVYEPEASTAALVNFQDGC